MILRKDRIMATAAKLFEAKGYHETSVEDIAKAAGLTKGGLYYHIASKEDLLFLIQDELLNHNIAGVKRALAGKKTATEKLETLIRVYMRQLRANRDKIAVIFYGEKVGLPEERIEQIRGKRKGYIGFVRQIVRDGIASGEFRQDVDPQVTAYAVLGMCLWSIQWYREDGRLNADEIADVYATLSVSALKG